MNKNDMPALVDTNWLGQHLENPDLKILDASYFVPGGIPPAHKQYVEGHIPGAIFFNINDVAEPNGPKEHAFPSAATFADKVGALGITASHRLIVYDHLGGACAAARVWYMFRAFGHAEVAVLDGGRTKWIAEKRPFSAAIPPVSPEKYKVSTAPRLKDKTNILANIASPDFQLLDARSRGRFEGTEPEPRPGLRSGHIPGSLSLPFLQLLDNDTKTWKDPGAIRAAFDTAGIDLTRPLVTTCGSGVSACALALGAYLAGTHDVGLYDGSWVDWGSDPNVPVSTGAAER